MATERKSRRTGSPWPEEYQCAVLLSFDFDAESDELRTAPEKIVPLTKGRYGATVGLERIFRMLEELSIPATFFVPGWVAENYPERTKEIQKRGFEIAGHGYLHEKASELGIENEKAILQKCINEIRRVSGRRPVGYRAPWFDFSRNSLELLTELGFEYDSSLMNQDLPCFVKQTGSKGGPLVELPVEWCLDDYPAFEVHRKPPREVREIWQSEFDALYSDNSFFILTLHPECIGRPARIEMLQEFVQYMQSKGRVWLTSATEVSKWWLSAHAGDSVIELAFPAS